jgi:hypothetical protein
MPRFLFVALLLAASTISCTHPPGANTPGQPVSAEQQVYASLMTIQTAIEGVKAESVNLPDIGAKVKPDLNKAIDAYNVAEKAFQDFEAAKKSNLANPDNLLQIERMVADLQGKIAVLGKAFGNSTPNPAVNK